jgi:hypothetical protein
MCCGLRCWLLCNDGRQTTRHLLLLPLLLLLLRLLLLPLLLLLLSLLRQR